MIAYLIFALLLSALVYFLWRSQKYYKGVKLPPGPIRLPVIGSIPQMLMIDSKYPYKQADGLRRSYGNIMSIGLGVNYAVMLSSLEIINDLLKRPEFTLERYRFQFSYQRTKGRNLGIAFSYGETWTEVRRFTVRKLREFGFGKTGSIDQTVRDEMWSLMHDIRDMSGNSGGIWQVDTNRLSVVSINVLWSCVGGYRFDPTSDFIKRHIDVNAESFQILRPTNPLSLLPFLKVFPEWSGYRRHGEIHKTCWKVMEDLVNDAKLKREGRHNMEAESFVEVFLDEIEKNRHLPDTYMTEDQLITVIMDLFLAGTDTTGTAMNWMILCFTLNQEVQDRARAEVMKMSKNGTVEIPLTASTRMPYAMACIYESMRFCPFGTIPPPRQTSCDVFYDGYIIPKGTCILYNLYTVFHDTEFWGDPKVFRPERFLDFSETSLDQEKLGHFPQFGIGKRICPGESLAMDTLFGFVISLLSTFSLEAIPGMEPTYEPGTPGLALAPMPYQIKFIPLN